MESNSYGKPSLQEKQRVPRHVAGGVWGNGFRWPRGEQAYAGSMARSIK